MSIRAMFKRYVIATLLTITIIMSLVSAPNRIQAENGGNLALNPSRLGFPSVSASFTCACDNVWNAVDGSYSANRWTSYNSNSPDGTDSITIDFGSAKSFNQVKLYIYNDGGGVKTPANYTIQYWNGSNWIDAVNQSKTPVVPTAALYNPSNPASILNTVNFDMVTSPNLKIIFTSQSGSRSGVVELEVFLDDPVADQNAANSIISAIQALPPVGSIALSDKLAVTAARSAYSNLTASQRLLVTNLNKLTDAEAAIALLVAADVSAANAVIATIGLLPNQADVILSNKSAIEAARLAYSNLTESQQVLVTNLNKLLDAEAAITALEAPILKNITVLSAFSNAFGDTVTLKLSSVLDITYSMSASKFALFSNEASISIANVDYDSADSSHSTIKLTLSNPALLNSTSATLSFQSGALKTSSNEINNAVSAVPVITFLNLDLSHDNKIGVDDIVQMINNPLLQIDVNQDHTFDREDILILLGQISIQ